MDIDGRKKAAAERALEFIDDGMVVGLGTGSTSAKFVDLLGAAVAEGLKITGVASSEVTQAQAAGLGIALATLDEQPHIDVTVDGADEISPNLSLIKGGGGALLREKIVAMASERMIIIADDSKCVETLGAFPLPVEIDQFGITATILTIDALAEQAGCEGKIDLRLKDDNTPFVTDGGNFILDCKFGEILEPEVLAVALAMAPGVVESGLFVDFADLAIIGGENGVMVMGVPDE